MRQTFDCAQDGIRKVYIIKREAVFHGLFAKKGKDRIQESRIGSK
jgi:hypothetical protein